MSTKFELGYLKATDYVIEHRFRTCRFVFFSIGAIILTAFCVLQLLPLVREFNENNSIAQIEMIKPPLVDEFRRPNLTICLPYYSKSLSKIADWLLKSGESEKNGSTASSSEKCSDCDGLSKNGWNSIWNEMDLGNFEMVHGESSLINLENLLASSIVRKLFSMDYAGEILNLNHTNYNWNQPLVDAVQKLFACSKIFDLEMLLGNSKNSMNNYFCQGFDYNVIEKLNPNSRSKLFRSLMKAIDNYLHVDILRDIETKPISTFDFRLDLTINRDRICFSSSSEYYQQTFAYRSFPEKSIDPPWKLSKLKNDAAFSIFVGDGSRLYEISQFDEIHRTNERDFDSTSEKVRVEIDLDFKILDKRQEEKSSACSENRRKSIQSCILNEQIREIYGECSCVPSSFQEFLPQESITDYCNLTTYQSCKNRLDANLIAAEQICIDRCEYVFYKFKTSISTNNDDKDDLVFEAIFPRNDFPTDSYLEFRIDRKISLHAFLGQIGGLLGLFLGLSGLGVWSIFLSLIDCLHGICARAPAHDSGSGNSAPDQSTMDQIQEIRSKWLRREDILNLIRTETSQMQDDLIEDLRRALNEKFGGFDKRFDGVEKRLEKLENPPEKKPPQARLKAVRRW